MTRAGKRRGQESPARTALQLNVNWTHYIRCQHAAKVKSLQTLFQRAIYQVFRGKGSFSCRESDFEQKPAYVGTYAGTCIASM